MQRNDDFIFDVLKQHNVPFVIIGGHAVNFHGRIRLTEDTDVIWRRTPGSEQALFAALTKLDAKWLAREIDPTTGIERECPVTLPYIRNSQLMMLWTAWGFLDLFSYVPGVAHGAVDELFQTSVTDGRFRFASREWLIRMKERAGRAKDLEDIAQLPETPDPPSRADAE